MTARRAGRGAKLAAIMRTLAKDPYAPTQSFERLLYNMKGFCSRRIDYNNRVVYTVEPNTEGARDEDGNLYEGIVVVHESWGHVYDLET